MEDGKGARAGVASGPATNQCDCMRAVYTFFALPFARNSSTANSAQIYAHQVALLAGFLCTLEEIKHKKEQKYLFIHMGQLRSDLPRRPRALSLRSLHRSFRNSVRSGVDHQLSLNFRYHPPPCTVSLCRTIAPLFTNSPPLACRVNNLPYFVRPARRPPNWSCFFAQMTPFCLRALPLLSFDEPPIQLASQPGSPFPRTSPLSKHLPLSISFSGPATITVLPCDPACPGRIPSALLVRGSRSARMLARTHFGPCACPRSPAAGL